MKGAYALLFGSPQQKHHFAYTEAGASARGNVYASVQKASVKTSFCVYRSRRVLEGRCIRFWLGALSESMYTGQTMYTLLRRKLQQKHHFAYTEAGASARGNVYASVQKALSESMILRIQILGHLQEVMYTLLCRSLQ